MNSAIIFVCSSLVPSPNSSALRLEEQAPHLVLLAEPVAAVDLDRVERVVDGGLARHQLRHRRLHRGARHAGVLHAAELVDDRCARPACGRSSPRSSAGSAGTRRCAGRTPRAAPRTAARGRGSAAPGRRSAPPPRSVPCRAPSPSTGKPLPGAPSSASSGTKASSKCTSARLSRFSVRIGKSPIVMPGVFGSTRNAVTPPCFFSRSTVATTKKRPACAACEMNTLVPVRRQPPSARVAGRAHVAEVGAAAGLGEAGGGEAAARRDLRQPALLLRLAAVAQDRGRDERVRDRHHRGDHPVDRARAPRRSGRSS